MLRFITVIVPGLFIAVFSGNNALAADNAQIQQILNKADSLEKQNDELRERVEMLEKAQKQAPAASTAATLPPAQPDVDGTGFFASADYNFRKLNNGSSLNTVWESGFRASIGYRIPEEGLDVLVKYNYYRAPVEETATGYSITPTSTTVNSASYRYSVDEAVIEVGDRFKVTNALDLRLHLGAQYTRIEESVMYYSTYSYYGPFTPPYVSYSGPNKYDLEFQGYGLRLGVDCNYCLGKGLSLSGGISGGFLVGTSEIYRDYYSFTTSPATEEFEDVVPICAADIGLGYDFNMSKSSNLNVSLGYEFNEYFNTAWGIDYILHGPYFRARLDF